MQLTTFLVAAGAACTLAVPTFTQGHLAAMSTSEPEPEFLPRCRLDGRPGTCQHGSACADIFRGSCGWYYCNRGNLERWIECGTKGCTYLEGHPTCDTK